MPKKKEKEEKPNFSNSGGDSDSGAIGEIYAPASIIFYYIGHLKIK